MNATTNDSVLLEVRALRRDFPSGESTITVLKDDGSVETRNVRVGINNNVTAQILEGVSEGERVITGTASAGAPTPQQGGRMRPPMGF